MIDLKDYKVGDKLPVIEDSEFSEALFDSSTKKEDVFSEPALDSCGSLDTALSRCEERRLRLIHRFKDHPELLSEYPSSESEVDQTTRTSIRDILFSYTGDVDVSKYRIPAPPQASLELTREGINYDNGDVDPEFATFAIRESLNDREGLMDARDVINQEEFHQNVFRRQEKIRSRQENRSDTAQPSPESISSTQSGPDSTSR